MKDYFKNLNLFPATEDVVDEEIKLRNHRTSIIITRVYLIVLSVLLMIMTTFFWLNPQTILITIHTPTTTQFNDLPLDANCPCSHVSIDYGDFTSMDAIFHQVCSSDFVTDRWIRTIYSSSNATYFFIYDFRIAGSAQFQALASFCRLVKSSVRDSINTFKMTSMISTQTMPRYVFQSQLNASIQEFQQKASNRFRTQLELVRRLVTGNEMMTHLQTNKWFSYGTDMNHVLQLQIIYLSYQKLDRTTCDCITDINCGTSSLITNLFNEPNQLYSPSYRENLMIIPGFQAGCLPVDALLLSTLECFYNQTCINELLSFFSTNERFSAMMASVESRFSFNSTLKIIVDDLMVERWSINVSFDQYYNQCAPISCTYSIRDRQTIIFVLNKLVGSLGGLTVILGLILPFLIKSIRAPRTVESVSLSIRIGRLKMILIQSVIELNIFKRHNSDERQIRYQRIATRLYIVLLIIFTITLATLSLAIEQTHRSSIVNPTQSKYRSLEAIYGDRLSCPCKTILMSYNSLMTINPQYHQICSSDFITDQWIFYVMMRSTDYAQQSSEYRVKASNYFRLLSMFCDNTRKSVDDTLTTFLQTKFISTHMTNQISFESQINTSILDWQTNTINSYLRTVDLLGAIHYANRLSSNLFGSWFSVNDDQIQLLIGPWVEIGGCVCGLSRYCRVSFGIYLSLNETNTIVPFLSIPNFYFGCAPLDGLFQSTLEFVYNQTFLRQLDQYMYEPLGDAFHFLALDSTKNNPYETIGSIIRRLMIDTWLTNVSFDNYFDQCAPTICTFEYKDRNNLFIVIMTIIGVFGGLSLAIKIPLLVILRFLEKIMNDLSCDGLRRIIRHLLICPTQSQVIHRLHFILLISTLSIIYAMSSATRQTVIEQLNQPSWFDYDKLVSQYSDSIQCSCSNLTVKYESFLDIVPYFHAICSSAFVTDAWVNFLFTDNSSDTINIPTDYLYSLIGQSQMVSSLCQLSEESIYDHIRQLKTNRLIETHLSSVDVLNERIRSTTVEYRSTSVQEYLGTIDLIRETIGANMIMSFFISNWRAISETIVTANSTLHTRSATYDECDCGLSWKCTRPSVGLMQGCYPTETLLQTTIECFYNQQCIDPSGRFPSLNRSTLGESQFNLSSTFQLLLNHSFVENYSIDISYQKYYNACAPSSCSYSYVSHRTSSETVTSLVSLYGGLVIITRCLAELMIHAWYSRHRRISPQTTT